MSRKGAPGRWVRSLMRLVSISLASVSTSERRYACSSNQMVGFRYMYSPMEEAVASSSVAIDATVPRWEGTS